MNAVEFFQRSAGQWRSQRTTHHLAFQRAEMGDSDISVVTLEARHPSVVELCQLHGIDADLAAGGALINWEGRMKWDQEDENHKGSTVMAIVPDPGDGRQGRLLRERGYAEEMPVAGHFFIDEEDGLNLVTEYDTMSAIERFWFASPDLRLRSSTVKRFGGFSTATFCTETRVGSQTDQAEVSEAMAQPTAAVWAW